MHIEDLLFKIKTESLLTDSQKCDREIVKFGKNFIIDYFTPLILESKNNPNLNPKLFSIELTDKLLSIPFNNDVILSASTMPAK